MNNFGKNIAVWVVISLVLVAIFNVFHLRDGFSPLLDGPLDPLDRYKNPKNKHIFIKIDIGPLFSSKRSFNTIIRCQDPSRIIQDDLEFNPVLLWYFFEL